MQIDTTTMQADIEAEVKEAMKRFIDWPNDEATQSAMQIDAAKATKRVEARYHAAQKFGLKPEEVLWYNSGNCYDRVGVTNIKAAQKVADVVNGQTVNGGMFDGMPLGQYSLVPAKDGQPAYYDVTC